MKNLRLNKFIIVAIILLLRPLVHAEKTANTKNQPMSAQVEVTKNAIRQMLAGFQLKKQSLIKDSYSNPDFVVKANQFNKKVELALIDFEKNTRLIFEKVQNKINFLNEIKNSTAYTDNQKKAILNEQLSLAYISFRQWYYEYFSEIIKLFTLDMPKIQAQNSFCSNGKFHRGSYSGRIDVISEISGKVLKSSDSMLPNIYFTDDSSEQAFCNKSFGKNYYYILAFESYRVNEDWVESVFNELSMQGCYSSNCVVLYNELRSSYVEAIGSQIYAPISFGKIPNYIDILKSESDFNFEANSSLQWSLSQLLKPIRGATRDLPFEITQEEYEMKLEEERIQKEKLQQEEEQNKQLLEVRKQNIQSLNRLLLTPPSGFLKLWSCPRKEVRSIKTKICQSKGCLTPSEISQIIKTITELNPFRKQERIECLETKIIEGEIL
ncbi:MAG TPA: hypothetical protein PLJ21_04765 [Pseudobdellovibrionaceae bacterium]|nr:hypothetical protein [Pseudobdellovibrionaceae bacterium]